MKTFTLDKTRWLRATAGLKVPVSGGLRTEDNEVHCCAWLQFRSALAVQEYLTLLTATGARTIANRIIEINDNQNTTDDEKIEAIKETLLPLGFEMEVAS